VETSGIFDTHHPPSHALADDCVHCGFCLPSCPTYLLWGQEADSPRGRIYLMKAGLDGRVTLTDGYRRHFDTCLGCMACVTACPSGVQYDRLIEATRPQLERRGRRSPADRAFRWMIFALFPHPRRLRAFAGPLRLYQRSALQRLVRAPGVARLLPRRVAAMERLLPAMSPNATGSELPERIAAKGRVRRRVGLLLGCVQRVFFSGVNAATARVLAAEGCDLVIPREQGCCGALMLHAGLEDEAAAAARRLVEAFNRAGVDQIVVNAAGCGSAMKAYGELLGDDPKYAERARAFAAKCVDVSEVVADLEPRARRHPIPLRVAYHDACHLQHAQRITQQPRRALQTIPGLQVREIPESDICCGSAGIYNLLEPDAAAALRDRKVANLLSTDAEVVVSGNPGCIMQLASGLEIAGRGMRSLHLVEVLDASIRGEPLTATRETSASLGGKPRATALFTTVSREGFSRASDSPRSRPLA
jgi:glycolate oxidase iron-sulfur subunit